MIPCRPNTDISQCGNEGVCYNKNKEKPDEYYCYCPQDLTPVPLNQRCPLKKTDSVGPGTGTFNIQPKRMNDNSSTVSDTTTTNKVPSTMFRSQTGMLSDNVVACFLAIALIISLMLTLCIWRFLSRRSSGRNKTNKNKTPLKLRKNILFEERYIPNPQYSSAACGVPNLMRSDVTDLQQIGEGFFGKVFKGQLHVIDNNGVERVETVAVKTLKQTTNSEAEEDFIREVEIMSSFHHPNILSLIGLCPRENLNPPWMVFEYMPFGDLASVLRNSGHQFWASVPTLPKLSSESLLFIAAQISDGMAYLATQRFVHRDLACRNCLVGSDLIVKIADFGMSRDVYTCDYYKIGGKKLLPVRWMAPESIVYGRFTLESDIWSYGVVLWEIYSYGKQPYYGYSNEEVFRFILEGILLDVPEHCPEEITDIMKGCWRKDTKERVTFSDISNRLSKMKENLSQQNGCLPRPPAMPVTVNSFQLLLNEVDIDDEKIESILSEDDSRSQSLSSLEYLELAA